MSGEHGTFLFIWMWFIWDTLKYIIGNKTIVCVLEFQCKAVDAKSNILILWLMVITCLYKIYTMCETCLLVVVLKYIMLFLLLYSNISYFKRLLMLFLIIPIPETISHWKLLYSHMHIYFACSAVVWKRGGIIKNMC